MTVTAKWINIGKLERVTCGWRCFEDLCEEVLIQPQDLQFLVSVLATELLCLQRRPSSFLIRV